MRSDASCPDFYSQARCVTAPEPTPSSPSPRPARWSATGQIDDDIDPSSLLSHTIILILIKNKDNKVLNFFEKLH